jgi:hypothetical protein
MISIKTILNKEYVAMAKDRFDNKSLKISDGSS